MHSVINWTLPSTRPRNKHVAFGETSNGRDRQVEWNGLANGQFHFLTKRGAYIYKILFTWIAKISPNCLVSEATGTVMD